jgi:predicted transposase YbfD/YdcC
VDCEEVEMGSTSHRLEIFLGHMMEEPSNDNILKSPLGGEPKECMHMIRRHLTRRNVKGEVSWHMRPRINMNIRHGAARAVVVVEVEMGKTRRKGKRKRQGKMAQNMMKEPSRKDPREF